MIQVIVPLACLGILAFAVKVSNSVANYGAKHLMKIDDPHEQPPAEPGFVPTCQCSSMGNIVYQKLED